MPSQDITHATIQKFNDWASGTTHPWGKGFILPTPASVPPPQPAEAAATPPATTESHDCRMRRLERKMDALHDKFSAFTNGLSQALAESFAQQGTLMEWPMFGSAMPYQPPNYPPESGGHADI